MALLNILQAKSLSAILAIMNGCFHLPVPQLENVGISARVCELFSNVQLYMCLVVKVKSKAVKNNIA